MDLNFSLAKVGKGQWISECLLGVIDFPEKNNEKIWQISALESKKWSNQQSKSTFLLNMIYILLYGLLMYYSAFISYGLTTF